jgi:hypothetical protein
MTTANGSPPSLAPAPPETGQSVEEAVVHLPPAPAAPPAPPPRRAWHVWDHVLTLLVVALAFLTASFPARNSDVWFHLATGRLLARGQFTFGTDPFAYTTGQVYWACHAWLFDLALYGLYGLVGGAGLVVLKALLVTALAALLLRVRRPGGPPWVPAVCTTLAVLAMSPRLLLQPACASYFLLGLSFWLLWRPHARAVASGQWLVASEDGASPATSHQPLATSHFFLLLVFVLWVNVDEWFLLGPVLAALFWLGERLGGRRLTPGWVVPAGLAVCLLNPHTFHAFTPPAEFSPVTVTGGLRQDGRFAALFASPWQADHLRAARDLNAAALAYFALTVLGLASFLLYRPALRGWRLVVWLPFALLAAWQARAIPFFVVVAAPVTALNVQDFLAGRSRAPAGGLGVRVVRLAGRSAVLLALLALIALTWPGWLAGAGRDGRHVAWGLQPDPSLQRAAETLHQWRRQKLLPEGVRVFAASPEVAQYGAWFAPGEKHFFDHRYQLFGGAARDYEAVCAALLPGVSAAAGGQGKGWPQVLREHGAGVVVFHDREPQRLYAVLRRLADDPEHWTLLHVAGQAVIAAWNEVAPPDTVAALAFDADRLAFGPQDERGRWALPAAPGQGPDRPPSRAEWWRRLSRPPGQPAWESAAATVYLHYADDGLAVQRRRQLRAAKGGYAASLAGLGALPSAAPTAAFQLVSSAELLLWPEDKPGFLGREQLGPFFVHLADRPPALPLLAVRAARRAVAADPEDANAWLRLGQAYLMLRNDTREHSAQGALPPLVQLRHVQVVTALEEAVRLDPSLEVAHHELAYLYGERNYLDQSLEHRRDEVRLSRRAGPRAGETAEEFAHRLEFLDKDTAKLVEEVQERRKAYDSASSALQGDRRAQADLALKLGLARQAADDILLPTPADLLGPAGIKLELELLLSLGRSHEVRAILRDPALETNKQRLGTSDLPPPPGPAGFTLYPLPYHWPAYEWLHVRGAAAVGDYVQARERVRAIRQGVHAGHERLRQQPRDFPRAAETFLPGLLAGPAPFLPAFTAQALVRAVADQRAMIEATDRTLRAQQADLCVLEGLLALEQGDTDAARSAFAEAEELCGPPAGGAVPCAGRPIAAGYLGHLNAAR